MASPPPPIHHQYLDWRRRLLHIGGLLIVGAGVAATVTGNPTYLWATVFFTLLCLGHPYWLVAKRTRQALAVIHEAREAAARGEGIHYRIDREAHRVFLDLDFKKMALKTVFFTVIATVGVFILNDKPESNRPEVIAAVAAVAVFFAGSWIAAAHFRRKRLAEIACEVLITAKVVYRTGNVTMLKEGAWSMKLTSVEVSKGPPSHLEFCFKERAFVVYSGDATVRVPAHPNFLDHADRIRETFGSEESTLGKAVDFLLEFV